jgi:membrane associated rhomboid family serine protease
MTGMIHLGRQIDSCPGCGQTTSALDWTCHRCGRVLDRYLFGTITSKSVAGGDKDAFWAGYNACMSGWKETRSVEIGEYRPVPGHETAYRAGWQHAADKIEAKDDRKRGRRRGLQLLGSGAVLTLVGGPLSANAWGSHGLLSYMAWPYVMLGAGILNLVLGVAALLTGVSDAVPPPPPGTSPAPADPESPPEAIHPARALSQYLKTPAPSIFLTWIVVALNTLVFLAMLAAGNSIFNPTPDALIHWGADFGPRTTAGEWWRLATSMFLHVGLLHIAFNMFAFMQIGPPIERLFGKAGFVLVYLAAGLSGGLSSLAWNPHLVSAGASGAIFGLYGALLGFLARHRHVLPPEILTGLTKGAIVFLGYNLVYGLASPNIDVAAHIGGLVGGFLCAIACSLPLTPEGLGRRRVRYTQVAAATIIVLIAAAAKLPRTVDYRQYLKNFGLLETRTTAKFNAALKRFRTNKIPPTRLAGVLDTEVFSEWMATHDALAKAGGMPKRQTKAITVVVRYMELRHDAWLAFAAVMLNGNVEKLKEAVDKQRKANEQAKELARLAKTP